MNKESQNRTGLEVAVIGMAGRFPGANNCREFWENLKNGVESITFFSGEELKESGETAEVTGNNQYVPANSFIEGFEYFDADFFDYPHREAAIINPQLRLFLECSWEALEDAGYDPETYDGLIGVYAGASSSFSWEGLSLLTGKSGEIGSFSAEFLTNKDLLCSNLSYKLDLKGPSFITQSACSTSLVAIHLACRAILLGECHMALAGGVSVREDPKHGYMYIEGMILSPDGHCRTFDEKAKGTVGGNGVGVVLLKRLKSATADGDHIYALVSGSAINNDGRQKVGFTAPSVEGQAYVIRTAIAMARVKPESISYVEAHGTGTELGDPIEIEALNLAFQPPEGSSSYNKQYCAIGSVKTNVGHLDTAAGVTGFIKTALALKNRLIPPSLHFETPNPKIDFSNSPFYVNTQLTGWKNEKYPRRAGVNSFGIGGTNAHVVLEEAPVEALHPAPDAGKDMKPRLIILSARSRSSLEKAAGNLAAHCRDNPDLHIGDMAYTLQLGRKAHQFRQMMVVNSVKEITQVLTDPQPPNLRTSFVKGKNKVVFMFSGQGSQYVNMGLELYQTEPTFRAEIDLCLEILKGLMDYHVKEILYPGDAVHGISDESDENDESETSEASDRNSLLLNRSHTPPIDQTEIAQPLLFAFEYALARLLMKWGIKPYAMIGHSIGEYTAACLAGVFSLEDALRVVVLRGRLMQAMPAGSMLSVRLPENRLKTLLSEHKELALDLAAVNSDNLCVVSGPDQAAAAFEKILAETDCDTRKLHTSHAFHSSMMDPVLEEFQEKVKEIHLDKPKMPFISNLTGDWIAYEQAVDPGYWTRHLRQTIRFANGLDTLLQEGNCIFVEVGPGKALNTFARQHKSGNDNDNDKKNKNLDRRAVNLVRHPGEDIPDYHYFLDNIGRLWLSGVDIDWKQLYHGEKRYRITLPTYPFDRQRCWIEGNLFNPDTQIFSQSNALVRNKDIADWFYIPSWKKTTPPALLNSEDLIQQKRSWLIFLDDLGLGKEIAGKLQEHDHEVIRVMKGDSFKESSEREYTVNVRQPADYDALLENLLRNNWKPGAIVHLWGTTFDEDYQSGIEAFSKYQDIGYYGLIFLARALANHGLIRSGGGPVSPGELLRLVVITNNVQAVTDEEMPYPEKTTLLGPCKTISQEYQNITSQCIDILVPGPGNGNYIELVDRLVAELLSASSHQVMAYRGSSRWVQYFEPIRLEHRSGIPLKLKEKGVYLVIGGLGKDSLIRAKYLAKTIKARLILTGRTGLPERREWDRWLETHEADHPVSEKIKKIREIEAMGGEVLVIRADAANLEQMQAVMEQIDKQFGTLNGVIHAAGITSIDSSVIVSKVGPKESGWHFTPKIYGLYTLEKVLAGRSIDFCLLTSSLASFLAGGGVTAYTAANIFMDAFARTRNQKNPVNWMSLNWVLVSPEETNETFHRVLNLGPIPQVAVSFYDLEKRAQLVTRPASTPKAETEGQAQSPVFYRRSDSLGPYMAPTSQTEVELARIWEKFFSITPLGIYDNFFDLNGDSLSAVSLISRIHQGLEVEISLAEFFKRPTIRELSQYIEQNAPKSAFMSIEAVEQKEYYPLSSAQKRLFILYQIEPGIISYNLPNITNLRGDVNVVKMEETFKRLILRHESLRTSFEMIAEEPAQRVHDDTDFKIEAYESDHSPGSIEEIIRNFRRPFNLTQAPLMRVGMIKFKEARNKEYVLMMDSHHIISDGACLNILISDFVTLYAEAQMPALKVQYKDYSQWQYRKLTSGNIKKQEEFWLKQFAGPIPVVNLPLDYPRPVNQDFDGDSSEFTIEGELYNRLDELIAREKDITLFMTILAVFTILLSRYSAQDDIVVGSPSAGRNHTDLENLIGMFVNMMVIRNKPTPGKHFMEFLHEVKQNALNVFTNQDYQYDELVDKLGISRNSDRNPLFDYVLVLEKYDSGKKESSPVNTNLTISPYPFKRRISRFDLLLRCIPQDQSIVFELEYKTAFFKPQTIEKIQKHLVEILYQVTADTNIKIQDITLSSDLVFGVDRTSQENVEFNF